MLNLNYILVVGENLSSSPYILSKSAYIGQSGGELILPGGVKLTVPPHALSEKVEIVLGVTFDPRHHPQVGSDLSVYLQVRSATNPK